VEGGRYLTALKVFRPEFPGFFHTSEAFHGGKEQTVVGPHKKVTALRLQDKDRPVSSDAGIDNGQVDAQWKIQGGAGKHPTARDYVEGWYVVAYIHQRQRNSTLEKNTLAAGYGFVAASKVGKKADAAKRTVRIVHNGTSPCTVDCLLL
jgi:hypothetical protein